MKLDPKYDAKLYNTPEKVATLIQVDWKWYNDRKDDIDASVAADLERVIRRPVVPGRRRRKPLSALPAIFAEDGGFAPLRRRCSSVSAAPRLRLPGLSQLRARFG